MRPRREVIRPCFARDYTRQKDVSYLNRPNKSRSSGLRGTARLNLDQPQLVSRQASRTSGQTTKPSSMNRVLVDLLSVGPIATAARAPQAGHQPAPPLRRIDLIYYCAGPFLSI
jgi:hypothetical protein